jgi:hypothetical protein
MGHHRHFGLYIANKTMASILPTHHLSFFAGSAGIKATQMFVNFEIYEE